MAQNRTKNSWSRDGPRASTHLQMHHQGYQDYVNSSVGNCPVSITIIYCNGCQSNAYIVMPHFIISVERGNQALKITLQVHVQTRIGHGAEWDPRQYKLQQCFKVLLSAYLVRVTGLTPRANIHLGIKSAFQMDPRIRVTLRSEFLSPNWHGNSLKHLSQDNNLDSVWVPRHSGIHGN